MVKHPSDLPLVAGAVLLLAAILLGRIRYLTSLLRIRALPEKERPGNWEDVKNTIELKFQGRRAMRRRIRRLWKWMAFILALGILFCFRKG